MDGRRGKEVVVAAVTGEATAQIQMSTGGVVAEA
jgi:hypothetical protein